METIIAALANAVIDTIWLAALTPFVTFGRRAAVAVESPLVAQSRRDLAAFASGAITHAEFTARADVRAAALKL